MTELTLFEELTSIDNLRKAWVRAEYYARTQDVFYDGYAYRRFDSYLETNLRIVQHELSQGIYEPNPLRYVMIPKDDDHRKVYFASPRDSTVIQAIINVVGPMFESRFVSSSLGNRLNIDEVGSDSPYRRWQDQYNEYVTIIRSFLNMGPDAWYLITDIEDFYPTIAIGRLLGILAQTISDERILQLLQIVLRIEAANQDNVLEPVSGLPPGVIHSHFLSNVYMAEFDDIAVRQSGRYVRYVDDICMVFGSRAALDNGESVLVNYLSQLGHQLHPGKTLKRPIHDWRPLIEHSSKMKYATQLDLEELLDAGEDELATVSDAQRYFGKLYQFADRGGDIDNLVQEAASIVIQLKQLEAQNVADIALSLLETIRLKPSALRVVLSALLNEELPHFSERFRNLIEKNTNDYGYFRTVFLQLLPHFATSASDLKELLISQFTSDQNYLVRAGTYYTLALLANRGAFQISADELRTLRENEDSSFSLGPLVYCYSAVAEGEIWASLASIATSQGEEIKLAVSDAFINSFDNGHLPTSLLESIIPVLRGRKE